MAAPSVRSYVIAALLVLAASLGVTFWTWNNTRQVANQDVSSTLNTALTSAEESVRSKVSNYVEILKGASGLFIAPSPVTTESWSRYVQSFDLKNQYPGLQSLGFSQVVPASQLDAYVAEVRSSELPNFTPQPNTPRDTYVLSRFSAPAPTNGTSTLGYDAFTEPVRHKAMETASDTAQPAITTRLVLLRDAKDPHPGFVIFVPVYNSGLPITNQMERRTALLGYVSAGVRSDELIQGLLGRSITKDSALRIYDGKNQDANNLIYESNTYASLVNQPNATTVSSVLNQGSNSWTFVSIVRNSSLATRQQLEPKTILWLGSSISVLVAGFLLILMISRSRAIAYEKQHEVQKAQDSLLSLASHQLRTPATGVKQFVGMVLQGYAGTISSDQRAMLEKAYKSNERQLEIINQILHVTRADAGRLILHVERLDLNHVIREIIDEHTADIRARKQKIIFRAGKKPLYAYADRQYISMVIDNLVSNASKYSHAGKVITVSVTTLPGEVSIAVKDHGVGMGEDDIPNLFQKFSRLHNELSVEAGGSGIGLYLCHEIITLHHGTIEVSSSPGEGSCFTVTIPKKKSVYT